MSAVCRAPMAPDRSSGEDVATLRETVAGVVARQREIGLDVINEGEYTKGGDWLSYVDNRFSGFEARPPEGGKPVILQGKDREEFADFYRHASERGTLFYEPGGQIKHARPHGVATAPISYRTDELPPSTMTSTCSVSIHLRTIATPTSGLFWLSAETTTIGLPSTVPPKSSTAICAATTAPRPPAAE